MRFISAFFRRGRKINETLHLHHLNQSLDHLACISVIFGTGIAGRIGHLKHYVKFSDNAGNKMIQEMVKLSSKHL